VSDLKKALIVSTGAVLGVIVAGELLAGRFERGEAGVWETRIIMSLGIVAGTFAGLKFA